MDQNRLGTWSTLVQYVLGYKVEATTHEEKLKVNIS